MIKHAFLFAVLINVLFATANIAPPTYLNSTSWQFLNVEKYPNVQFYFYPNLPDAKIEKIYPNKIYTIKKTDIKETIDFYKHYARVWAEDSNQKILGDTTTLFLEHGYQKEIDITRKIAAKIYIENNKLKITTTSWSNIEYENSLKKKTEKGKKKKKKNEVLIFSESDNHFPENLLIVISLSSLFILSISLLYLYRKNKIVYV
ncbi:MAG: hypothetical protein IPK18_09420 [Sphingobacteriales bacterium]|jgi:hypothetical protein|nr:MAG: hypothetical protein IPK18_09420 [Sphingobacteriales bacterium]